MLGGERQGARWDLLPYSISILIRTQNSLLIFCEVENYAFQLDWLSRMNHFEHYFCRFSAALDSFI